MQVVAGGPYGHRIFFEPGQNAQLEEKQALHLPVSQGPLQLLFFCFLAKSCPSLETGSPCTINELVKSKQKELAEDRAQTRQLLSWDLDEVRG
jgi:hypothetical protein